MTITHRKTDCGGHVRFTFRTDAVGAAKRMRWAGRKVEVFGCAVCGGWHVGGTSWLKGTGRRPSPRTVRIELGGLECQ
ncbi:hypothetical protein [Komagataeibacter diospyri]|uniref:hypothetical protein n=1 Tax=Komagataeibacter diospyri TaxID=1932662 RepID=UPI003757545E